MTLNCLNCFIVPTYHKMLHVHCVHVLDGCFVDYILWQFTSRHATCMTNDQPDLKNPVFHELSTDTNKHLLNHQGNTTGEYQHHEYIGFLVRWCSEMLNTFILPLPLATEIYKRAIKGVSGYCQETTSCCSGLVSWIRALLKLYSKRAQPVAGTAFYNFQGNHYLGRAPILSNDKWFQKPNSSCTSKRPLLGKTLIDHRVGTLKSVSIVADCVVSFTLKDDF